MKGSSELLAIDLGKLPSLWLHENIPEGIDICQLVVNHSHTDPKLRGFGAATCFDVPDIGSNNRGSVKYRLACGKGIKNIHIWQFTSGYFVFPGSESQVSW